MVELTPENQNLLEMVIRAFDCCLMCAAHVVIVDKDGKEIAIPLLDVESE